MAAASTTPAVLLALCANVVLAAAQIAAYAATGSAALLSTAIHALIVASSLTLLRFGGHRSDRASRLGKASHVPTELHFWSFVAPILLLSMGAGLCIFAGVERLRDPRQIVDPHIAYATLGFSVVILGFTIWSAVTAYNAAGLQLRSFAALRAANEPALFSVLVQGLAALTSVAVALGCVLATQQLAIAEADGLGALAIGSVMAAAAALLALETRALLATHLAPATIDADAASRDVGAPIEPVGAGCPAANMTITNVRARAEPGTSPSSPSFAASPGNSAAQAPNLASAIASHSQTSRKARKKSKRSGR